ncbi:MULTISPECIES: hypothetical protein [unclassified Lactobacillus]|uniref:hypothetical protein n=1 Tax=unclassified Lactobacillus TaxID=2620435 RepID=UPI000EFB9CDF|nr:MULTISPECIES: hypothetical protein [unclassified Lactobacillus]RMC24414.1 hypothetical protein F5ESL0247_04375 [Lactobacillus sp. ESL0247]RMC28553.1 hypothetical protein F5ESL0246_04375 [Lactobacillus sp. ESL0246]RMC31744.1 hypothetical protein F5ESL0245_04380 [Lactobacillus sp. ESL0245]
MQKFGKTLITDSGRRMLVQVDGAQGQITYTNAALFTQDIKDMSEEDQIALTALTGQQLITPVSVSQVTDTTVTVSASFNNSKVTEDLKFNSIGWYAKTSVDKKEQLMAVTPSLTEQTLVAGAEGASTSSLDIDMVFGRSHDTTVVLNPNQEGVVNSGQMQEAIDKAINDNAAQLKAELAKSYAAKDEVYPKQDVFSKEEIKSLAPLNAPDGNNVYDTTINLDTYSAVGTTKFLECKLQSSGQMSGFDQATDKLYGWIFNVPKWNGASELQQIVYICNYGQGTLTYARSRVNGEDTNVENFEKILTDKDLKAYADGVKDQIKNAGNVKSATINGGSVVTPDEQGNLSLQVDTYTKDESDKTFVKTVDGLKPDSTGNVQTDHYSKAEVDRLKNDLLSRIEAQENRELIHDAADYDTGLAYSKAHPHVLVATP